MNTKFYSGQYNRIEFKHFAVLKVNIATFRLKVRIAATKDGQTGMHRTHLV